MARISVQSMNFCLVALVAGCTGVLDRDTHDSGAEVDSERDGGSEKPSSVFGGDADACEAGVSAGSSSLTRLSSLEYQNSVRRLLGVELDVEVLAQGDEIGGAFVANVNAPVSEIIVEEMKRLSEAAAEEAIGRMDELVSCTAKDSVCARQFVSDYGARAYRRPLTDAQVDTYMSVFELDENFETGMMLVIEAMLQSPHFLYRIEADTEEADGELRELDGYELAARLAFALQNGLPDAELRLAAESGGLATVEGLREQAIRLLQTDEAGMMIGDFHQQWLGLAELGGLSKDSDLFPAYDNQLRQAMLTETRQFVDYVVREDDGRLDTLLNAPYSFLEGPLFELYGVTESVDHDPSLPVPLGPEVHRGGLLAHASVLAASSHSDQTSPILRGLLIREHFLCEELPPPPPNVDDTPPALGPDATTRDRFAAHVENPACASCHQLIDPVGLAFENFDAIGRYREEENGIPVDASGQLVGLGGESLPFDGVEELSQTLSESAVVRACVARQWFQYVLARKDADDDACSAQITLEQFEESDFNIRELLFSIVTSDSFRHVRKSEQ